MCKTHVYKICRKQKLKMWNGVCILCVKIGKWNIQEYAICIQVLHSLDLSAAFD